MLEKRKILGNSAAIFVNRLIQSITAYVLTAIIARLKGPDELGQYLLAFSYFFIFMTIVSQGLRVSLIRHLSTQPSDIPKCLTSGSFLQLSLSILGYLALAGVVLVLPYNSDTTHICQLMGLMLIPFSLWNITEAIFLSQDKAIFITLSVAPIYILRVAASYWVMRMGYGLSYVAIILIISEFIVLVIQWLSVLKIDKPSPVLELNFIKSILKSTYRLFFIEGVAVSSARAQLFILSVLSSEATLGLYGSVLQLIQPFAIISNSVVSTTFPSMSRATKKGKANQKKITEFSVMILMAVAIPCIVGAYFLGKDLLQFVYGDAQFSSAAAAFLVVSFTLLAESFIRPFSFLMVANHMENINLREVFITGFFSILLSMILIPKYQLMGAAYSYLLVQAISLLQYGYALCSQLFMPNIMRMARVPIVLGCLMTLVFLFTTKYSIGFSLSLVIAVSSYLLFVGITFAWLSGKLSKYTGGLNG